MLTFSNELYSPTNLGVELDVDFFPHSSLQYFIGGFLMKLI